MTGPEHYTTAETHLAAAEAADTAEKEATSLSYAHTHATLALAAAAALGGGSVYSQDGSTLIGGMTPHDEKAWIAVAGVRPDPRP
jgi:hypothetical protein